MNTQTPMSGNEAAIIALAALIAWLEVAYGPRLRARIKVWRSKPPKSWSKRSFWS